MDESWENGELALIEHAAKKAVPISGSLELLPLCNMNCKMCYVRLSNSEMRAQGHVRSAKDWLRLSKELKESGTLFLTLTGGEPLLHPQFKEIYLGLKALGMIITINTNGTLIDESWASFFAENKPRRINITLYGSSAADYAALCGYEQGYERATNAVRFLKEKGIAVKINGSLVRDNADAMEEVAGVALSMETALHVDTYMYPARRERKRPFDMQSRLSPEEAGRASVHFDRLSMSERSYAIMRDKTLELAEKTQEGEKKPAKMRCQAGKTSFSISWQGMLRPCVMLTSPSISVFETGFKRAWKELREGIELIELSPDCNACSLRAVCQTCAACALYEAGDYAAVPKYMCRYTKARLKALSGEKA